jgi:hypothetical protein
MRRWLALAVLALSGCGSDPECDKIARSYAAEVAAALRCDPGARDACAAVVRASLGAGSSWCDRTGVDPGRAARIEDLLGDFAREGCPLGPAPPCPTPPEFVCRQAAAGESTCQRKGS